MDFLMTKTNINWPIRTFHLGTYHFSLILQINKQYGTNKVVKLMRIFMGYLGGPS